MDQSTAHSPATQSQPPHVEAPPQQPANAPRRSLLLIALLAIFLGLAAAWAVHERNARHRLTGHIDTEIRHTTFIEARTDDLLRLLSRRDTQIIRLTGAGAAQDHTATVIWNPRHAGGFVYSDLPGPLRLTAAVAGSSAPQEVIRFEGASRPTPFHLSTATAADVRFAIVDLNAAQPDEAPSLFLATEPPAAF